LNATASAYLWGLMIVSNTYPNVKRETASAIPHGGLVIVLSEYEQEDARLARVFCETGLHGHLFAVERIDPLDGPFYVLFIRAVREPHPALS
jgi:hypothetical protein